MYSEDCHADANAEVLDFTGKHYVLIQLEAGDIILLDVDGHQHNRWIVTGIVGDSFCFRAVDRQGRPFGPVLSAPGGTDQPRYIRLKGAWRDGRSLGVPKPFLGTIKDIFRDSKGDRSTIVISGDNGHEFTIKNSSPSWPDGDFKKHDRFLVTCEKITTPYPYFKLKPLESSLSAVSQLMDRKY